MQMRLAIVVTLALVCSACGAAEPESPFGVVCPWGGLRSAGIRWVRCGAGATALGNWPDTERQRGVFDWTGSDGEIKGIEEQGLMALPIMGYTPGWASSAPDGKNSAPPKDIHSYSDFVKAFVQRYRGRIGCVEIWNEPDIGFFSGTTDQYAEMLKAGYSAAKLADPNCKVLFGGTAGINLNFIDDVYSFGGGGFFDVMAVHPYQWGDEFNDEWFRIQLAELRDLMNRHGDCHKPIWLTELGWSTGEAGITEDVQARLLAQAMVTSLSLRQIGVEKAFWFCVKDWGGPGHGLLRDDGSRKPAYWAYCVLTRNLAGAQYVGRVDVGKGARCHVFRRPSGATVAVIWSASKQEAPVTLRCKDGAVSAQSMLGQRQSIPATGGELTLIARPQPVYLFDAHIEGARPPDAMGYAPKGVASAASGVWVSAGVPEGTSKAFAVIGGSTEIGIIAHNVTDRAVKGWVEFGVPGAAQKTRVIFEVGANSSKQITAKVSLRPDAAEGVYVATGRGECGGKPIALSFPIRVARGDVIEFLANSTVEGRYMFADEGSGGAPSVRFNGKWTYKFDLSKARSARVRLNVGAHEGRQWKVSASRDNVTYKEILSGASNRSWHDCDLKEYAGGDLYLRFEGDDQQLEELVLTWNASD